MNGPVQSWLNAIARGSAPHPKTTTHTGKPSHAALGQQTASRSSARSPAARSRVRCRTAAADAASTIHAATRPMTSPAWTSVRVATTPEAGAPSQKSVRRAFPVQRVGVDAAGRSVAGGGERHARDQEREGHEALILDGRVRAVAPLVPRAVVDRRARPAGGLERVGDGRRRDAAVAVGDHRPVDRVDIDAGIGEGLRSSSRWRNGPSSRSRLRYGTLTAPGMWPARRACVSTPAYSSWARASITSTPPSSVARMRSMSHSESSRGPVR